MVDLIQVTNHLRFSTQMVPEIVAQNLVDILLMVREFGNSISSSPLLTLLGVTKLSEGVVQLANETTFRSWWAMDKYRLPDTQGRNGVEREGHLSSSSD